MFFESVQRLIVALNLKDGVFVVQNFRRCEMAEDTFQFDFPQALHAFSEGRQLRQRQPQARHAGVDLQVNRNRVRESKARSSARKCVRLIQTKNCRR